MEIINGELVPALDVVGQGFEKGTMFLPQLLMSAEATKAGFEAIRQYVQSHGEAQEKKKQRSSLLPSKETSTISEKKYRKSPVRELWI